MKFFIDSPNIEVVRQALELGIVSGCTTNPHDTAMALQGESFVDNLSRLCSIVPGEVCAQVVSANPDRMVEEAHAMAKIAENVVVKIPATRKGIKAISMLEAREFPVAATAVNSATHAALAVAAGADYVIPYYGLLEATNEPASNLVEAIVAGCQAGGHHTKLIYFAKTPRDVRAGFVAGAYATTMTWEGLTGVYTHYQSEFELEGHAEAWAQYYGQADWVTALSE